MSRAHLAARSAGLAALLAGLAVAGLVGGGALTAADDDRPLDARTYVQALESLRQGRRDEALRALRRLATDFPDSPYAAPAIFKVVELLYPVAGWSQVGSATPAAIKEAGDLLLTLTQKYRSSREAPKALVKLGYLALEPANPKADLDEACGRFATAAQVYPDSDAADDAYFGSGQCEALRARPARAADVFSRLLDEHPGSPLAPEALYRAGVALSHLDGPAEAILALQEVRRRYPDSRVAARALERITLLHRLRLRPAGATAAADRAGPPELYRYEPEYGAAVVAKSDEAGVRGSSDLAVDAQGLMVLASPRAPGVFRLDAKGKIQERIQHPGPEFIATGDGLQIYISGRDQIAVNARNWSGPDLQGLDGRAPRDFGPIGIDPMGRVYLLDRTSNALLIFDRGRRLVGNLRAPSGKDGRLVDVAMGEDGGIFVLDSRAKLVIEMHQGKELSRTSLAALGVEEPIALAVDALGDFFVLDGRTGWVSVADPQGKRITVIRPPKEAQARLGDPAALAVDALGRVYLSGRKTGQVVRFQ